MDIWCQEITNMWKWSMWKPKTDNKALPIRLLPMEGQQKETQYPGWHKYTIGKGMWSAEDNKGKGLFEEI